MPLSFITRYTWYALWKSQFQSFLQCTTNIHAYVFDSRSKSRMFLFSPLSRSIDFMKHKNCSDSFLTSFYFDSFKKKKNSEFLKQLWMPFRSNNKERSVPHSKREYEEKTNLIRMMSLQCLQVNQDKWHKQKSQGFIKNNTEYSTK